MVSRTTKPITPDPGMSTQACGCDAGAGHTCADHQFQSPESSNILGALYNPVPGECIITFQGGRRYRGTIALAVWWAFKGASSKGGFFTKDLKEQYVWTRL